MQDGNFVAEHLMQIGSHRGREPNFRNQQNRRPPLLEHLAHAGEIDSCLSRSQ